MRTKTLTLTLTTLVVLLFASQLSAGPWDATVKLGGIILDEEGDQSTVQETYNIYDGFAISQLRLAGRPSPKSYLLLDLRELNLDSRNGSLVFRKPGTLKLTGSFDQHRQVFDADRAVISERKDWNLGANLTPARWLRLGGSFNYLTRDGERLSYPEPAGGAPDAPTGALGTDYDYALATGRVSAEVRKNGRGLAVDYRVSDFTDDLNAAADRTGRVVSARAYGKCALYDKWTHLLRGAYGVSELSATGLDYTLAKFEYTGVVKPVDRLRFKYNFDAQRVDNASTNFKTDRFQNIVDATVYHKYGSVTGGYGYEINDDDRRLTSYNSFRAGAVFRCSDFGSAKIHYSGREKKDQEELTLLKDVEASRFRGDVELRPFKGLAVGGGFNSREREYPDIDVESEGQTYHANAHYSYAGWGGLSCTYSYSTEEYEDLAGRFDVNSNVVTGRIDFERIRSLRLSSGVTYLDAGEDLDIEKSILFFEGAYSVTDDLHLEAKYNIYNYDDFVLLDRYYTANVVWLNVVYDLHLK